MLNNGTEISKNSKILLITILKIAQFYARCISKINPVPSTKTPADLQRDMVLPYMVLIYGKIITVYRLLNGYSLEDLHPGQVGVSNDPYSCYDIVRSLYECFLQSNFIITRYQTNEAMHYIGLWWHIRAFSERAIMAKNRGLENTKLVYEASEIERYKTMINESYSELKHIDEVEFNKDSKQGLPSWPKPGKLYEMAGVHRTHHNHIYKRSSLYSHSEPYALMQLGTHFKGGIDDLDGNILTHGTEVLYFSVMALKSFSRIFQPVEELFSEDADLERMYESAVNFLGTELSRKFY